MNFTFYIISDVNKNTRQITFEELNKATFRNPNQEDRIMNLVKQNLVFFGDFTSSFKDLNNLTDLYRDSQTKAKPFFRQSEPKVEEIFNDEEIEDEEEVDEDVLADEDMREGIEEERLTSVSPDKERKTEEERGAGLKFSEEFVKQLEQTFGIQGKFELVNKNNASERMEMDLDNIETLNREEYAELAENIHKFFVKAHEMEKKSKKEEGKGRKGFTETAAPSSFVEERTRRDARGMGPRERQIERTATEQQSTIEKQQRDRKAKARQEEKDRKADAIERGEIKREIRKGDVTKSEIKSTNIQSDRKKETR